MILLNEKSHKPHILILDEACGIFLFLGIVIYTSQRRLVYTQAMKTRDIQRGVSPWLWVSNRGEQHPCWHTTLPAKSSVLYLCGPLTLQGTDWRGGRRRVKRSHRACHHLVAGSFCSSMEAAGKGISARTWECLPRKGGTASPRNTLCVMPA